MAKQQTYTGLQEAEIIRHSMEFDEPVFISAVDEYHAREILDYFTEAWDKMESDIDSRRDLPMRLMEHDAIIDRDRRKIEIIGYHEGNTEKDPVAWAVTIAW